MSNKQICMSLRALSEAIPEILTAMHILSHSQVYLCLLTALHKIHYCWNQTVLEAKCCEKQILRLLR
jgi:hypothetical protein